jgi:hypothetical protein
METSPTDEKNEDNQKEKTDLEEEDIEAKLISTLEKIDGIRKKNMKQREKLKKIEEKDHDLEYIKKKVIILKTQLEEEKMIEKVVRRKMKEKEENCKKLKDEIVSLRKELEKKIDHLNSVIFQL